MMRKNKIFIKYMHVNDFERQKQTVTETDVTDVHIVILYVAENRARPGWCDGWHECEKPGGEVRGRCC